MSLAKVRPPCSVYLLGLLSTRQLPLARLGEGVIVILSKAGGRGLHLRHNGLMAGILLFLHRKYWKIGNWEIVVKISKRILYKVWDEITYPFPNFNGTVED